MASSAVPAPGTRVRSRLLATSIGVRTGRAAVAGLLLALVLLLVLLGTIWVHAAHLSDDRAQDVPPAVVVAGEKAVVREIDPVAASAGGSPVQQYRIRPLRPLAQRDLVELQPTAGMHGSHGLHAVRAVVLQDRGGSGTNGVRPLSGALPAVGELPDVGRADVASATRTTRGSLVVAGLVGSLLAAGAATGISRSNPAPPNRAPAVLRGPADGRPGRRRRRRPATEDVARCGKGIPPDTGAAIADVGPIFPIVAPISDRQTPAIASLIQVGGVPGAVVQGARQADLRTGTASGTRAGTAVRATAFAAARSRAHGPTTALWHAVELHRPFGEIGGPCQLAVCGSLTRVSPEQRWPVAARDVCPACATLAH